MTTTEMPAVAVAPAVRRRWVQPGFLIVVAILVAMGLLVNVAASALQLHFRKQAVPLVQPLSSIPGHLGPWVQVSLDEPLPHDTQEMLGTDLYVMRDYVDSRRVSPAELAQFEGRTAAERAGMAQQIQRRQPDAVVNCAVTYYTGMVDTVAHIPERCYVASGYVPHGHQTVTWHLGDDFAGNGGSHDVQAEAIAFDDPTADVHTTRVDYCFFADGVWESDSVAVRERLQDLRARHSFYSKVELKTGIPDAAGHETVMADFARYALPAAAKCYPDWNSVEGRHVK